MWLIDYEYSGNNDPCFELGNTWTECELTIDQLEELVTAYYGGRRPAKVARAHLQAMSREYGWALWGFIQQPVSPLDFDFWGWGMERYERAVAEFDRRPGSTALLDEATAETAVERLDLPDRARVVDHRRRRDRRRASPTTSPSSAGPTSCCSSRASCPAGTTWHAAGLVGPAAGDRERHPAGAVLRRALRRGSRRRPGCPPATSSAVA